MSEQPTTAATDSQREAGGSALRDALLWIRDHAYDTNDECRWCGNDFEDDHSEDCAATVAISALVERLALRSWGHSEIRESPHPRELPDPADYAALPPSAPPALDVDRLASAIALVGPVDMADTDEAARAYADDLAAEYARLEQGR